MGELMSSMSEEQAGADDAALEDATTDTTDETGGEGAKDWEAEFKAQQKINRDLERKSKRAFDDIRKQVLAEEAKKKPADDAEKPDIDRLRAEIQAEAKAEVLRDRALDKIEAKAAGRFKDPEDALLRLGRNVDDFIDGGSIDLEAIEDALVELLEKRPDFGVTQGEPKRFKGTGDGGPKGNAGKPQLTESDVKRMSSEGKHAEIEQARLDGRLNTMLGIT